MTLILLCIVSIIVAVAAIAALIIQTGFKRKNSEQQQRLTDELRISLARLNEATANAANAASHSLYSQNASQLQNILSPLQQRISEFSKSVHDAYIADNSTRMALSNQIDKLVSMNSQLSKDADNLAKALKGNSKIQGDWGEIILVSLLEKAGMQRGVNFEVQPTHDKDGNILKDNDQRRQRPDVVVNLPQQRRLIIDSKVSLTAYTQFCEAESPEAEKEAGKRHVASVKNHIDELARKRYPDAMKDAATQVLMFIPNDSAFCAALNLEPSLHEYAAEAHVAIVAPAHLYSVILLVEQLWSKELQNNNTREIAKLGGLLYDSVAAFATELDKMERQLHLADESLHQARHVMCDGNKSIIARAKRLSEMGIKTNRAIPKNMNPDYAVDKIEETI